MRLNHARGILVPGKRPDAGSGASKKVLKRDVNVPGHNLIMCTCCIPSCEYYRQYMGCTPEIKLPPRTGPRCNQGDCGA